jgi:hypothetical protein
MDLRVGKNYQLQKKIGSGAFGEIFEGNCLPLKQLFRKAHPHQSDRRNQTCKPTSKFIIFFRNPSKPSSPS